jgi:hypothetical protein
VCLVLGEAEVVFGETSASLRGVDLADRTEYGGVLGADDVEVADAASGIRAYTSRHHSKPAAYTLVGTAR